MEKSEFAKWIRENNAYSEFHCRKDNVYVLSCGTNTYTWLIQDGALFTTHQNAANDDELANSIWTADDIVHSLDDDIMLPFHALTDSTILRFSSKELNEKLRSDPELAWQLAQYYHKQLTFTLSNYRHAILDDSKTRLKSLEERFAKVDALKGEKISDSTLALFMGMHRISVNRIRKKIEKANNKSE